MENKSLCEPGFAYIEYCRIYKTLECTKTCNYSKKMIKQESKTDRRLRNRKTLEKLFKLK